MRVQQPSRSLISLLLIPVLACAVTATAKGQEEETEHHPILGSYRWRQVGPANMSGRVSDIAVPPGGEASTIYVAAAAGGLWKTINNGTTWKQIFQGGKTAAVGDVAIAPSDPNVIYVGMGEPHSRNSISWGDGVYRSTDGGESWHHLGLEYTFHIGRIVVDPRDPDIVYVAALGNLWSKTRGDRGLYKRVRSETGQLTWKKLKGFDDGTGFYDVILDPENPDVVYATSWERDRKPWVFLSGGGPNNGIWKSTDAGQTWTRLEGNGLPPSEQNGKISLDIYPQDTSIIYARIENFANDPNAPQPDSAQVARMARFGRGRMSTPDMKGTYRSTDSGQSWQRVDRRNGRPFYYCQLRVDPNDANTVYLIDSPLYKMDVEEALKWVDNYESGGQQRGVGGGGEARGVVNITGSHHVDFHAMWIDPTNSNHLVVGSDGGVSVSWDQGETWDFCDNLALGQFYAVTYDMAQPYNVYGGLQDNGTWGGPHATIYQSGILNRDWYFYVGGDGFHVQVDPEDPDLVLYAESQGGAITRFNRATGQSRSIQPRAPRRQMPDLTEQQRQFMMRGGMGRSNIIPEPEPGTMYRFNWSSPIILSPHNPKTVYFGGNVLFKSVNRGETWSIISPDLTTADTTKINTRNRGDMPTGAENHCTFITIGESPLVPGLIWVGTDDGLVHLTRDGGVNWTEVTGNFQGVPANTWVSRVRPSGHEVGRAYVTFDGHRFGDITTYVFRTDDFGQSWKRLGGGLPTDDPAYVITEDPVNPNLVYLGTEWGVYVSLDAGESWSPFSNNLPVAPVHDLVVHPRDRDLIIATHGLSLWVMDDVSGLQSLGPAVMEKDFALLDIQPAVAWGSRMEQVSRGDKIFQAQNPSTSFKVNYWVGKPAEKVDITIESIDGTPLRTMEGPGDYGLNMVEVSLRPRFGRGATGGMRRPQPGEPRPESLNIGSYKLTVTYGEETFSTIIEVKPDPTSAGRN